MGFIVMPVSVHYSTFVTVLGLLKEEEKKELEFHRIYKC